MNYLRKTIEELGYAWDRALEGAFETYMHELKNWNKRVNLTSIESETEIEVKHFVDSVQILRVVKGGVMIDVGPGGGFPSIPAKIVERTIELVLIESSMKKVQFLNHILSLLGLNDVVVVHGRAEDKVVRERFCEKGDYVTGRAVAKPEKFLKFVHPLVKRGGKVIYMLGPNQPLKGLRRTGAKYSIEERDIIHYYLPDGMGERFIWIGERV